MQGTGNRLVVDCDPGHDDALALILAHDLAEVLGVTTVSGNAPLPAVTANALAVLELIGADTPVHAGAAGPLVAQPNGAPHALHVHGEGGLGGANLPPPSRAPAGTDAVDYLLTTSMAEPVWLVAIGRLSGISIMGGSVGGGNVTAAAEFNIWADPEAADLVFRSGARIRLCGLNLTHQLKSDAAFVERLAGSGSRRGAFAAQLLRFLHERMRALTGEPRAALHDPCAVLAVTHPELFQFEPRPLAVELTGTLTRGMTVVDERFSARDRTPQIEVAYALDAGRALGLLLAALEGHASSGRSGQSGR
jgi:inosine-uridine nucleoside N-ribohydrolase